MSFHNGKIYNMPSNLYFYKSNQPRLLVEYCKKVRLPDKILEPNNSCIEYCKNITIFPEIVIQPSSDSDDDSWVYMKKNM